MWSDDATVRAWAIATEDKVLIETIAPSRSQAIYLWITRTWGLTTGVLDTQELETIWERLRKDEMDVQVEIKPLMEE